MKQDEIKNELQKLLASQNLDYRSIVKLSNLLSKLDQKFQRFSIDAKTLIHLGRDSIKDHTTALIELVKNSYDADAQNVDVEVLSKGENRIIRVADNGFGMTQDELFNNWLRIGFSNKRESRLSQLKRRKTGEKGIGRISTDRLGACLELITKTEQSDLVGLKVNWDEFDTEGKDVFDIDVEITHPTHINIPPKNDCTSISGTEIIITKLRQIWTPSNIENLYYELSALTPPFNEVADFEINMKTDIAQEYSKKVDSHFFKASEIELTAIYEGKGPEIYYSIKDKYHNEEITEIIKWQQLLSRLTPRDISSDISEDLTIGPVNIKLLFFLREAASITGTDFKLQDLRTFLDNNAGVKIYRDNIAVRPYGFPSAPFGYDWLQLGDRKSRNPAGIGRGEDYMVNPNQLVGAAFITRDDNLKLTDSAGREGLIENEVFDELATLVMGSIVMLESHRAKIYPQIEKNRQGRKKISPQKESEIIIGKLKIVNENLTAIKDDIEIKGEKLDPFTLIKPLSKTIDTVEIISEDIGTTITELLNWQRVLSGLATVGISSAVFGHETERSITQFKGSTTTAKLVLTESPPQVDKALIELEKALKHSNKVAAWGAYALTRVQREKRQKRIISIKKTISKVVDELKPALEAASIKIDDIRGDNIHSKTFQMDIESILINLLTNAYTACLLKPGQRKIRISIDRDDRSKKEGYSFTIADSGPGIAKEFEHRIFEPLFSTKIKGLTNSSSMGTGLGLTIVKSIVEDLQGEISFGHDKELKGARFKIWLPKED